MLKFIYRLFYSKSVQYLENQINRLKNISDKRVTNGHLHQRRLTLIFFLNAKREKKDKQLFKLRFNLIGVGEIDHKSLK